MIPPDQVLELGKGVLAGVALIPVMWFMLRELKTSTRKIARSVTTLSARISELELKIAGDETRHKLKHLADAFAEHKAECRGDMRDVDMRVCEIERQLPKLWASLGASANHDGECAS